MRFTVRFNEEAMNDALPESSARSPDKNITTRLVRAEDALQYTIFNWFPILWSDET